ncbi:MAG TPA: hypothetical protein VNW06_00895, partial [Cytophagaceae bacterium]|nr:hypothetical protein [Cytophagaceae bacterium]
MKYCYSFILVFLITYSISNGCGNYYHARERYDSSFSITNLTGRFNIEELSEAKREIELTLNYNYSSTEQLLLDIKKSLSDKNNLSYNFSDLYPNNQKYQLVSDYALVLLKLGKTERALDILKRLYQFYPNEYNIVANLGTAYEISNMPDSALVLLKKAVRISPESHNGSEWIHIKLLERKINDLKYPKSKEEMETSRYRSIIGLDIEDVEEFYKNYSKQSKSYKDSIIALRQQLYWQLKERTKFVPPEDIYVSCLLYDLANLVAVTISIEEALTVYELSFIYNSHDHYNFRKTYVKLLLLQKPYIAFEEEDNLEVIEILGFLAISAPILIFIVVLFIKKKKAQSN